jgi:hypothetical protein
MSCTFSLRTGVTVHLGHSECRTGLNLCSLLIQIILLIHVSGFRFYGSSGDGVGLALAGATWRPPLSLHSTRMLRASLPVSDPASAPTATQAQEQLPGVGCCCLTDAWQEAMLLQQTQTTLRPHSWVPRGTQTRRHAEQLLQQSFGQIRPLGDASGMGELHSCRSAGRLTGPWPGCWARPLKSGFISGNVLADRLGRARAGAGVLCARERMLPRGRV